MATKQGGESRGPEKVGGEVRRQIDGSESVKHRGEKYKKSERIRSRVPSAHADPYDFDRKTGLPKLRQNIKDRGKGKKGFKTHQVFS